MAKQVYLTRDIAHLWASGQKDNARNPSRSFWFKGDKLYVHSACIAVLVRKRQEPVAALISVTDCRSRGWGGTNNIDRAIAAVHHLPHFRVACYNPVDHPRNLANYDSRLRESAGKAKKARDNAIHYVMNGISQLVGEANRYAEFFKLSKRFDDRDYFTLQEWNKVRLRLTAINTRRDEAEAKAVAKALAKAEEQKRLLTFWIAGQPAPEGKSFPYWWDSTFAHLRINSIDATDVQTTMGASVPLDHVRRALPIVLRLIDRYEGWKPNGHTIHLGSYELREITVDGIVRVGCHNFEASEVKRFAATLGITAE